MEKNNISYMDEYKDKYPQAPKTGGFLKKVKNKIISLFGSKKQKDAEYSVISHGDELDIVSSNFVDMKGGTVRKDVNAEVMANISGGTVYGNLNSDGLVEMQGGTINRGVNAKEFKGKGGGETGDIKAQIIKLNDFKSNHLEGVDITIGHGAKVKGNIKGKRVIIDGQVDGTITADEIIVNKGGKVSKINAKGKIKKITEDGRSVEINGKGKTYNMGQVDEITSGLAFNLGKAGRIDGDYVFSDAQTMATTTVRDSGEIRGSMYSVHATKDARISVRGGVNHLDLDDSSYANIGAQARVHTINGGKELDIRGRVQNLRTNPQTQVSMHDDGFAKNISYQEKSFWGKAA